MNALSIKKFALAAGTFAALGFGGQAMALPEFTVHPDQTPFGPLPDFVASAITGASSETVVLTSATTQTGSGWLSATGFTLQGVPIQPGVSGLGLNYGLYVQFSFTDKLLSGTNGAAGSTYQIDSFTFQFYLDPNNNTTFQAANSTANTVAAVTGGTGDDSLLGSGTFLLSGTAAINSLNGVSFNSIQGFALTPAGMSFFTKPVPFYTLAFTEFNNTTQGVTTYADGRLAINATGGVDFNGVPEPGSVALLGAAAVAAVVTRRRRKA